MEVNIKYRDVLHIKEHYLESYQYLIFQARDESDALIQLLRKDGNKVTSFQIILNSCHLLYTLLT